ncbi:hypothetical protein CAC42_8173 [Sphaceloma murrayae]|uniref:DUF676 domain-containing protein n=1 Tax=Sphaceloma murrayae TaxID=2082308 RepID=A0A2K1QJV0_9PEZI|nr:hypothetical protein CAC42_8173 [Sphaceloma murrayae]
MDLLSRLDAKYDYRSTDTYKLHFDAPRIEELDSPLTLFWKDVLNILQKSNLIFLVLKPFFTVDETDELYLLPPSGLSITWWTIFSVVQLLPMLALIVTTIFVILVLQALEQIHSILFWQPIQGPKLQVFPAAPLPTHNPRHRWIYINGIATGAQGLHQNLRVLSKRFNAPVLGIHNRTYGFLGDIIECIFQRSFHFRTLETRIAVPILRKYLETSTKDVEKVILVAHSQGGICASHILDQLFAEVPWDLIHGRLEVYTFGSAALHFKNPYLDASRKEKLVTHMEHYCHEWDMVTSFGALSSLQRGNTYKGKVFVWKEKSGHLLDQHYLKGMFNPETSFGKDGFLMGGIEPYEHQHEDHNDQREGKGREGRWLVVPGTKVKEGRDMVKDVSFLWTYMMPQKQVNGHRDEVAEGEGRVDEPVNGDMVRRRVARNHE